MKFEEKTNRDKAKEQFEEAQRKQNLEAKAGATSKFETVLKNMIYRNMKQATLDTLQAVKLPIFNKKFKAYLDSDYFESESLDSSSNESFSKKIKKAKDRALFGQNFHRTRSSRFQKLMDHIHKKAVSSFNHHSAAGG